MENFEWNSAKKKKILRVGTTISKYRSTIIGNEFVQNLSIHSELTNAIFVHTITPIHWNRHKYFDWQSRMSWQVWSKIVSHASTRKSIVGKNLIHLPEYNSNNKIIKIIQRETSDVVFIDHRWNQLQQQIVYIIHHVTFPSAISFTPASNYFKCFQALGELRSITLLLLQLRISRMAYAFNLTRITPSCGETYVLLHSIFMRTARTCRWQTKQQQQQ